MRVKVKVSEEVGEAGLLRGLGRGERGLWRGRGPPEGVRGAQEVEPGRGDDAKRDGQLERRRALGCVRMLDGCS